MTNHSETFRKRIKNRDLNSKSETDHITHFITRMKERFNIDLTVEQYYEMLKDVIRNAKTNLVYKLNANSSINETTINGKLVWVIYGRPEKKKFDNETELVARLKTALIPHMVYIVPPRLAQKYDHNQFTEKVISTIAKIKSISDQINMKKQNPYKVLSQLPPDLRHLGKRYTKDKNVDSHWLQAIVNYL